eukprot:CAMPEP_0168444948 /NCGR_PEP_ID=MMETSP0228-20121227/45311_1 /TAXON_ID=133427 /ORGANISM="Protoceratium reticulatum, Strain CCCM 535 (=CCMP 1889)" /LENGTH=408 /DNA_ID=CAMNT_0008459405 /DNA_START=62 /DNA_END=1285 /DNA_ORIENTATION=-
MPPVYSEALYKKISTWTESTIIAYVKDAKRPGSKSYERYQKYSQAKTVGEALALGAQPGDLLHDFHKKYLTPNRDKRREKPCAAGGEAAKDILQKFIKRMRGPAGLCFRKSQAKKMKAMGRLQELGIDLKAIKNEKNCQETNDLQAQRLAADCEACNALSRADKAGTRITDKDVHSAMELWAFRKNESRQNVLPEGKTWVNSDTLGLIRDRTGRYMATPPTKDYPHFMELLCRWLRERRPHDLTHDFPFTTISLNYGYAARRHRDGNNHGPSMIKAFGKFKGGRLVYWPDDNKSGPLDALRDEDKAALDISSGLVLFDGNRAHEVEAFTGERFSLVFFSIGNYWKASPAVQELLLERGFALPEEASMAAAKSLLPAPRGYYGQSNSLTSMFGGKEQKKVLHWQDAPES